MHSRVEQMSLNEHFWVYIALSSRPVLEASGTNSSNSQAVKGLILLSEEDDVSWWWWWWRWQVIWQNKPRIFWIGPYLVQCPCGRRYNTCLKGRRLSSFGKAVQLFPPVSPIQNYMLRLALQQRKNKTYLMTTPKSAADNTCSKNQLLTIGAHIHQKSATDNIRI